MSELKGYKRDEGLYFEAGGESWRGTRRGDYIQIEDTRKNGQEDTHVYVDYRLEDGVWVPDDTYTIRTYMGPHALEGLTAHLNEHDMPDGGAKSSRPLTLSRRRDAAIIERRPHSHRLHSHRLHLSDGQELVLSDEDAVEVVRSLTAKSVVDPTGRVLGKAPNGLDTDCGEPDPQTLGPVCDWLRAKASLREVAMKRAIEAGDLDKAVRLQAAAHALNVAADQLAADGGGL